MENLARLVEQYHTRGHAAWCLRAHHTSDDIQHSSTTLSLICISSTNYLGLVDGKRTKRLRFICLLNHLFVSASTNSSAAGPQIWQCDANATFTIYYHWDPSGPAAGGNNWCNKSITHTANVHQCEQKSLPHMGLVMFTMGHTRNLDPGIDDSKVWTQVCCVTTRFTIYARVCLKGDLEHSSCVLGHATDEVWKQRYPHAPCLNKQQYL